MPPPPPKRGADYDYNIPSKCVRSRQRVELAEGALRAFRCELANAAQVKTCGEPWLIAKDGLFDNILCRLGCRW